jgi:branched-chain amino acid transport system permease protein
VTVTTDAEAVSARPPAPPMPGSRRRHLVGALVILVAASLPALIFDAFWLFLAAQVCVYAIATLGLQILYGRTGQLSFAHASFMGIGVYTAYILDGRGWGTVGQLAAVVVVSLVLGAVVTVPAMRLSGLRLALVTLAFGELFIWTLTNTMSLTKGTQGAPIDPIVIGSLDTQVPLYAYLLVLVPAALATVVTVHLGRTQLGRRMIAVRDSELAARSVGISVSWTKLAAFLLAAVFAGIAGWLYGGVTGFVAPPDFNLFASVYLFVAVVVGGARSVVGAWLGAAYVVLVPQLFTLMGYPNLYPLVGGALLAIVALLVPDGIVGLALRLSRRIRRGQS